VWTISFQEVERGTVVRRFAGQSDLPRAVDSGFTRRAAAW
jgi:hypothetical protein